MKCILLSPDRAVQFHSSSFLVELHSCCCLMSAEAFMLTDLNIFDCLHVTLSCLKLDFFNGQGLLNNILRQDILVC